MRPQHTQKEPIRKHRPGIKAKVKAWLTNIIQHLFSSPIKVKGIQIHSGDERALLGRTYQKFLEGNDSGICQESL